MSNAEMNASPPAAQALRDLALPPAVPPGYEGNISQQAIAESSWVPKLASIGIDGVETRVIWLAEIKGRFNSPVDKTIARSTIARLRTSVERGVISPEQYTAAAESLAMLIPTESEQGGRQLAGKRLSPGAERLIASRTTSKEVDLMGPAGAWGKLPDIVKEHVVACDPGIKVELTSNCTVGCSFCSFADKGPIQAKASFSSVIKLMTDYASRQKETGSEPVVDAFYWGTDPFDSKWAATASRPERDYSDLAAAYTQVMGRREHALVSSTAIPLGEELRVLRAADQHLRLLRQGYSPEQRSFRISVTQANIQRAWHLVNVLEALHPQSASQLSINHAWDHPATRGSAWNRRSETEGVTAWDIIGPNCRDGIVIGVHQVDSIVMQGASPERPMGETRQPILTHSEDGERYSIPSRFYIPSLAGNADIAQLFPYATATVVELHGTTPHITKEQHFDDPHRALLRVAGALVHFSNLEGGGRMTPYEARYTFAAHFSCDIRLITQHATRTGNWVMRHAVNSALARGYVETAETEV